MLVTCYYKLGNYYNLGNISDDIDEKVADFILQMLSERKFNQTNVQFVMKKSTELVKQVAKKVIKEAAAVMNNKGLDGDDLVLDLVSKFCQWDLFIGLPNQRGQDIFLKNVLNMIEPRRVHDEPEEKIVPLW